MADAVTDAQAAAYARAAYDDRYPWERVVSPHGGLAVCLARAPGGGRVLAVRGTRVGSVEDLAHDLFSVPHHVADHPELGFVHAGFAAGLEDALAELGSDAVAGMTLVGHSLGGARAAILAALLHVTGRAPERVVTFGSPRPGFTRLADVLAPIRVTAYRNGTNAMPTIAGGSGHDIVTDLPLHIPLVAPYVHAREPLTDVSAPPEAAEAWGPFSWHSMSLYLTGMPS